MDKSVRPFVIGSYGRIFEKVSGRSKIAALTKAGISEPARIKHRPRKPDFDAMTAAILTSKDNSEFAALLEAVGRKDRAAFKALYDRAAPKLFAIALRILRERGPAEDALQEIFLRIWQNAASFSPDSGSALGWLIAIARNRSIDLLRSRRAAPLAAMGDTTELWEGIAATDGGEAERLNLVTLRRCLGAIEEPARSCVLLAYYEGYSREELSQRFDKPVNTIKTWLFRSLSLLKSCLESAS